MMWTTATEDINKHTPTTAPRIPKDVDGKFDSKLFVEADSKNITTEKKEKKSNNIFWIRTIFILCKHYTLA